MKDSPALICKSCGHSNEVQRVYCHSCGEKLDRSKLNLSKSDSAKQATRTAEQIRKQMKPGVPVFRFYILPLIQTVLLAALTGAVICVFTPPKMPERLSDELRFNPPQLGLQLENLQAGGVASRIAFSSDQVAAYLNAQIRSTKAKGLGYILELDRSAVEFAPQNARFFLIRQITWGFADEKDPAAMKKLPKMPFVISGDYNFKVKDGKLMVECLGATIGRLQLPAAVAKLIQPMTFASIGELFKRETRMLEKSGGIDIQKGQVIITSLP